MRVRLTYKEKILKWPALNTSAVFLADEGLDKELVLNTLKKGVFKVESFMDRAITEELNQIDYVTKLTQTNLVVFIKRFFDRFNSYFADIFKNETSFKITSCGIDSIAMAKEIRLIVQNGSFNKEITIDKLPKTIFVERALAYIYYGSRIAEGKKLNFSLEQKLSFVNNIDKTLKYDKKKNYFVTANSFIKAKDFLTKIKGSEYVFIKETIKGIKYIRTEAEFNDYLLNENRIK